MSHWDSIRYGENPSPRETVLLNIDAKFERGYGPSPVHFIPYPNPHFNTTIHAGIIHKRWKLLTGDPGFSAFFKNQTDIPDPYPSVQLFDLASDPVELLNLAPYFPSVVNKLLAMLHDFEEHSVTSDFPPYDEVSTI